MRPTKLVLAIAELNPEDTCVRKVDDERHRQTVRVEIVPTEDRIAVVWCDRWHDAIDPTTAEA